MGAPSMGHVFLRQRRPPMGNDQWGSLESGGKPRQKARRPGQYESAKEPFITSIPTSFTLSSGDFVMKSLFQIH